MIFFNKKEKDLNDQFLNKGYIIKKVESKKSLNFILNLIKNNSNKLIKKKIKKINLNHFHKNISFNNLNEIRLKLINLINSDNKIKNHYFNLARESVYALCGNELMMQKKLNLSIQLPNDKTSLLPVHSDVWSGDSPYELNLWIPLVDCYKTKSMFILKKKYLPYFYNKMKNKKIKNSKDIFNIIKNKIEWIDIKYGEFLIFDQTVPHGNVINKEITTRFSLNCRFKSLFSPYADKRIGEFFEPITIRASTRIGKNFSFPFTE